MGLVGASPSRIVPYMSTAKSWPRTIQVGHASVKVYRNTEPCTASGWIFVVAWNTPTGRKREKFANEEDALREARRKASELSVGLVEAGSMTRGDRDELRAARALTGDIPLLAALREWQKIHALTQGHAMLAAEAWSQRNVGKLKRIKVSAAVDLFIKGKEKAGKQGELTYRAKLKPLTAFFPDTYIDAITADQLSAYFEQWQNGVTRNDCRKRAVALWRWAQKSGYIPRGIQLEIENTERADEEDTEIGTITPTDYAKLLEFFRANHPQHLAAVVLAGFGAIRADEIHGKRHDRTKRQTWEDIDLSQKHLNVTVAKKNTPSWRLVNLCDAAVEWLLLCPDRKGPVCEEAAMEKVRGLAIAADFNLPENCFRHSAISYRIAVTGDKQATATWAGNSVKEIDKRYRRPMTKAAGEAWFAIHPDAAGELIPMEQGKAANA